jgi:hypothetical protein
MQIRCIRARSGVKVGDLAEVPDGAEFSALYYEVAESSPAASPPAPAAHAKESTS